MKSTKCEKEGRKTEPNYRVDHPTRYTLLRKTRYFDRIPNEKQTKSFSSLFILTLICWLNFVAGKFEYTLNFSDKNTQTWSSSDL